MTLDRCCQNSSAPLQLDLILFMQNNLETTSNCNQPLLNRKTNRDWVIAHINKPLLHFPQRRAEKRRIVCSREQKESRAEGGGYVRFGGRSGQCICWVTCPHPWLSRSTASIPVTGIFVMAMSSEPFIWRLTGWPQGTGDQAHVAFRLWSEWQKICCRMLEHAELQIWRGEDPLTDQKNLTL